MALPNCRRCLTYFTAGVEGAAADAERQSGDGDASAVEGAHGVDEAFAFFAEEIFGGDGAVFEDEFAGVGGAQAELVFLLAGAEAGRSFFDDEGGESVGAFFLICNSDDDRDVGVVAVGDEGLRCR